MRLEDTYREIIFDHDRHPHHAGLRDPFDAQVVHINRDGYDEVTMRVTLRSGDREMISSRTG